MLLVGLTLTFLTNCALPPEVDFCTIVNFKVAQCTPSSPNKQEYDKPLNTMLGYTCVSPDDQGEIKKYVKKLLKALE